MTTIKTLSGGRTLSFENRRLFVDGQDVGGWQLYPLAQPVKGHVAYAKTSIGNVAFTRAEVDAITAADRAERPVATEDPALKTRREEVARKYREWNEINNDGGDGHNPFADEYRRLVAFGFGNEPTHKSDT